MNLKFLFTFPQTAILGICAPGCSRKEKGWSQNGLEHRALVLARAPEHARMMTRAPSLLRARGQNGEGQGESLPGCLGHLDRGAGESGTLAADTTCRTGGSRGYGETALERRQTGHGTLADFSHTGGGLCRERAPTASLTSACISHGPWLPGTGKAPA